MSHKQRISKKKCAKCGLAKDVSLFGRDASRPDGRYSYCKECRRKPNRRELEILELAEKGLKRCSLCRKVKPMNAYNGDSSKSLGVTSRCKKCHKDSRQEKAKEYHADMAYISGLHIKGQNRCFRCKAIKDFSLFLKNHRQKHGIANLCLDCNNSIRRNYNRLRNKDSRDYIRWDVFEDDNFTCYLCEEVLSPDVYSPHPKSLSIDHVIPVSKGGLDIRENVRTACLDCNRKKNDFTLEEFLFIQDKG